MTSFEFTAWTILMFLVWVFPFTMLNFYPWERDKYVVVKKEKLNEIPPYPAIIITDRYEGPFLMKRNWNIQRSVNERGQWFVEYWQADNLHLVEKSYIYK